MPTNEELEERKFITDGLRLQALDYRVKELEAVKGVAESQACGNSALANGYKATADVLAAGREATEQAIEILNNMEWLSDD